MALPCGLCVLRIDQLALRIDQLVLRIDQLVLRIDQLALRIDQLVLRIDQLALPINQLVLRIDQLALPIDQLALRIDQLALRICLEVTPTSAINRQVGNDADGARLHRYLGAALKFGHVVGGYHRAIGRAGAKPIETAMMACDCAFSNFARWLCKKSAVLWAF